MRAAAWLQGGPEGCRVGRKGLLGHVKQSGPSFKHFSKGVVLPMTPAPALLLAVKCPPKWPGVPFAALWGCTQGFDSRARFSRGWRVPVPITATRRLGADGPMGGGPAGDGEKTPGGMRVGVPPSPCSCPPEMLPAAAGDSPANVQRGADTSAPRSVSCPCALPASCPLCSPAGVGFPSGVLMAAA